MNRELFMKKFFGNLSGGVRSQGLPGLRCWIATGAAVGVTVLFACLSPHGAYGETLTLKTYYPPMMMSVGYGISSELHIFDNSGKNKLLFDSSSEGALTGIVGTADGADINVAAPGGYIYLSPANRNIVIKGSLGLAQPSNGDMTSFCVWKALAKPPNADKVYCPVSQPVAIALADGQKQITYDSGDIGENSGYMLCCAVGVVEPFTFNSVTAAPAVPLPAGGTPAVNTRCYPRTPDIAKDACPAGQTGNITKIRFYTCPGQVAGSWMTVANSCMPPQTCVLPKDEIQELNCPYPQTGTITQTRTWSCSGATPVAGPWGTTTTTCRRICTRDGNRMPLGTECCSGFDHAQNDTWCCGTGSC